MIGNKFLSVAGASEPTDAQFNYVTMLLHGDGTNGAQNNTFVDSSTNNFTITRNGNPTQGSFSPYGSGWSNQFDGTSYLQAAYSSQFALGTSDFTIEGWVYVGNNFASSMHMFTFAAAAPGSAADIGYYMYMDGSNNEAGCCSGGSYNTITGWTVNAATWTHFAMVRQSGTLRIYINGVQYGTTSASGSTNSNAAWTLKVGAYTSTTRRFNGNISNFRIVNGTCVYPNGTTFTPSTTPLTNITNTALLTCQSNRFVDNSSNAFALTLSGTPSVQRFNPFGASTAYSTAAIGGSGYFDGTGDYLSVATNTAFAMGTGDFTLEAWVYATAAFPLYGGVVGAWDYGTSSNVALMIKSSGALYVEINGVGYNGSTVVYPNRWTHVAVTRSGTTLKTFVNGVVDINQTNNANIASTYAMTVNGSSNAAANSMITGYIADARVVKGGALYTAAFTPPTAPLTTTVSAGTVSLLCNMTNGAIYDNAMMNDLETVGNAQISTSVKKYGTGSLAFDGTGDYLKPRIDVTSGNLGSGDFTLECWLRVNTTDAMDVFGTGTWSYYVGASQSGWAVSQISNLVAFSYSLNNTWVFATTFAGTTLSTGTWYHVAIVRSSGVIKCYLNGTASSTTISNSSNIVSTSSGVVVGGGSDPNTYNFNGYIDDLRITKGYARYTTTFTPPTAALANKSSS